jgi:hypothetical protein
MRLIPTSPRAAMASQSNASFSSVARVYNFLQPLPGDDAWSHQCSTVASLACTTYNKNQRRNERGCFGRCTLACNLSRQCISISAYICAICPWIATLIPSCYRAPAVVVALLYTCLDDKSQATATGKLQGATGRGGRQTQQSSIRS